MADGNRAAKHRKRPQSHRGTERLRSAGGAKRRTRSGNDPQKRIASDPGDSFFRIVPVRMSGRYAGPTRRTDRRSLTARARGWM